MLDKNWELNLAISFLAPPSAPPPPPFFFSLSLLQLHDTTFLETAHADENRDGEWKPNVLPQGREVGERGVWGALGKGWGARQNWEVDPCLFRDLMPGDSERLVLGRVISKRGVPAAHLGQSFYLIGQEVRIQR